MTAGSRFVRSRAFPVLTTCTLMLTVLCTATRVLGDGVVRALRRDPHALRSGELWRVITPVLVQTDRSVIVVIAVCALCAVVGVIGEQQFSRREWLVLYVVGALVGHAIGEVFQPRQGGTSVAFAAILGALAARAVTGSLRVPRPVRVEAAIAVPLAIVDTIAHDIHGLPFLAGFVIVLALDRRAAARAP